MLDHGLVALLLGLFFMGLIAFIFHSLFEVKNIDTKQSNLYLTNHDATYWWCIFYDAFILMICINIYHYKQLRMHMYI